MRKIIALVFFAIVTTGCSIPNLETPECIAARPVLREFYSAHFGGEMKLSAKKLESVEKFLTPEFARSLRGIETDKDVFTTNDTDPPRAFRVTGCETAASDRAELTVLLFWRSGDQARPEQKAIKAEMEKRGDAWLVNKIDH